MTTILGVLLLQVELAGSHIFDYVHLQDHQELAEQLGLSLASKYPYYFHKLFSNCVKWNDVNGKK